MVLYVKKSFIYALLRPLSGIKMERYVGGESSLMLFSVRDFVFALEIGSLLKVAEISAERVSVYEEAPFRYRFNFRGNEIPIVDMSERTGGMPTPLTGFLQLLVVEINSCPFALLIDKVLNVVKGVGTVYRFPEMLRTEQNRYLKAVCRLDNKIYLILEPGPVLKDTEIAALRAF